MYEATDLIKDFLYKEVFIVHEKNPSFDSELVIVDDESTLRDYIQGINTEEKETPNITHGIIFPIKYISKDIVNYSGVGVLVINNDTTPESDELNSLIGHEGLCSMGKLITISESNNTDGAFDKLTNTIEEIVEDENLVEGEFFLVLGYNIDVVFSIDENSIQNEMISIIDSVAGEMMEEAEIIKIENGK